MVWVTGSHLSSMLPDHNYDVQNLVNPSLAISVSEGAS
jgi:hypothetical protein